MSISILMLRLICMPQGVLGAATPLCSEHSMLDLHSCVIF